jgi:hypothetical protein
MGTVSTDRCEERVFVTPGEEGDQDCALPQKLRGSQAVHAVNYSHAAPFYKNRWKFVRHFSQIVDMIIIHPLHSKCFTDH